MLQLPQEEVNKSSKLMLKVTWKFMVAMTLCDIFVNDSGLLISINIS